MATELPENFPQDPDLRGSFSALKRAASKANLQRRLNEETSMNLANTIYAHAQALPDHLQREALDFITYLEQRYKVEPPSTAPLTTAQFIERFAGCIGDDFPEDISDADLGSDVPRDFQG